MPNLDNNPANGLGGQSYLYDYGTTPNTRTAVSQKVRLLTPHYGNSQALHQMGVLSEFGPTESRAIEPVRGIGFGDQVAELVPGVTEQMTGTFSRALLYLCNLWQATGYAAGIEGPVRSIKHHRWPFDTEQQLVFSSLADNDLSAANVGTGGQPGTFQGGTTPISYPEVTMDNGVTPGVGGSTSGGTQPAPTSRGHSAIITIYEACWFNGWNTSFAKDAGMLMESGDLTISDVHDFASVYGEFLATGNDPTIGQLGSIRFSAEPGANLGAVAQAGAGIAGGGALSGFVNP
jgi:hypothetical protein